MSLLCDAVWESASGSVQSDGAAADALAAPAENSTKYKKFRLALRSFIEAPFFVWTFLIITIIDVIAISLHWYGIPRTIEDVGNIIDLVCSVFFLIEFFLKVCMCTLSTSNSAKRKEFLARHRCAKPQGLFFQVSSMMPCVVLGSYLKVLHHPVSSQ